MNRFYAILLAAFFVAFACLSAQTVQTGDEALDESLNTLTEQTQPEYAKFIETHLALRFNQPKTKLIALVEKDKMECSEVFVISFIAAHNKLELDSVISVFKKPDLNFSAKLEHFGFAKGNKDYKKLLKASINVHPKPFIPTKKKK